MFERVFVNVKEGRVRGFKTKSAYSGVEYCSFLGLPYGQSTARFARFKDPVPVKPWNGFLDATVEKGGCFQMSQRRKKIIGSEDCLYNNIYTPKIPSKRDSLKAVIVHFHSGGFIHGSPDPQCFGSPDYIMHQDIVYVCVAHRLHVLGFLNLNMKDCSGNQSIKDVILSLKWIKSNIAVFGGDPENITLLGSSSGAMLVHFLLLSPLAKGLYHKVILMGMHAFNPLVYFPLENVTTAYELAKKLGYVGQPGEDKKLLNFYKKMDLSPFVLMRSEYYVSNGTRLHAFPCSPFTATVASDESSPFTVSLDKLIPSTNRVPIMIGFCEREGCMALALRKILNMSIKDCFLKCIRQNCFGWGAKLNEDELKLVQREVENFYLNGEPIETASDTVLCDIITDISISDVYDSLIDIISEDLPSSVYVYNFLYDGKTCLMKSTLSFLLERDLEGAFHAADFSYWNYAEEHAGKNMVSTPPKDKETIETITGLLTTFAKTSDPNYEGMQVKWKPTNPNNPSHLIIDETLQIKDELLNGKRMEFWHKLRQKFKKHEED